MTGVRGDKDQSRAVVTEEREEEGEGGGGLRQVHK